jgi:hypothetical protein
VLKAALVSKVCFLEKIAVVSHSAGRPCKIIVTFVPLSTSKGKAAAWVEGVGGGDGAAVGVGDGLQAAATATYTILACSWVLLLPQVSTQ